ncbi:AhpC/TSA family protein [Alteribacillus bidgolensis]|uniref:AhpC/TSA family protein n=1 Tax=Alteribacillus bidgolensis TaxID=930129 RepID=A0A1G8R6X0_9BACI|nr:AhpC/TSA family protein [Alteribacillus bidgolensis]
MELNENLSSLEEENAVVVGAVTDPLEQSKAIAEEYNIDFPITYDVDHKVGSKYGVHNVPGGMDMGPVNTHSIFVIDEQGTVRWHDISPHEMYVPLESILEELKKL